MHLVVYENEKEEDKLFQINFELLLIENSKVKTILWLMKFMMLFL